MSLPAQVRLIEVGPRDGLQNEKNLVETATKLELIHRLGEAGLRDIEATAFVSPRWVPQMADSTAVMQGLQRQPGVTYSALTPNLQGFEAALETGVDSVAVFAAASESFSRKNINCTIAESLERFRPVMEAAHTARIKVRGYVSCVAVCPYEGEIAPEKVADVATRLRDMGCYEISLGDTTGAGTPGKVSRMIEAVARHVPMPQLAGHYHDTYGMAIANIWASLNLGMSIFDTSVSGLGGCPYAAGASGNVATEDVVYLLHREGVQTGIDLEKLLECSRWISGQLGRACGSKTALALLGTENL